MPTISQVSHARACIADAEREENSLTTRVDAAIQALAFLDQAALDDVEIQRYLSVKYERPLEPFELQRAHARALTVAKKLLFSIERK
jgi:predicted XRE-type DNA-binding protein